MQIVSGIWRYLFWGASFRISLLLRVMFFFQRSEWDIAARFVENRLQIKYGMFISRRADLPNSIDFPHPVGIVIGEGVKLGARVKVFQNVTLGGARLGDWQANNYPEVGDDTVIFAGAVVIGKIKIGRHCVVGANAVVTKDVPDYSTVAGAPARIIRQNVR